MRLLASGAVVAALVLNNPAVAADPAPKFSAEDAQAGCVRNDLRPCMIALGLTFWFDMKLVAPQIANRNELDVNGKTAHRNILITAAIPNHNERLQITLTLGSPAPNDQVIRAELRLPRDPNLAHTASEYDKTWLYEAVSALFGKKCAGLDRLALYRFFENSVKPSEKVKTDTTKHGIFSYTKQTMDTEKIPFCGFLVSAHGGAMWDGPADPPPGKKIAAEFYIVLE